MNTNPRLVSTIDLLRENERLETAAEIAKDVANAYADKLNDANEQIERDRTHIAELHQRLNDRNEMMALAGSLASLITNWPDIEYDDRRNIMRALARYFVFNEHVRMADFIYPDEVRDIPEGKCVAIRIDLVDAKDVPNL